jgi:cytochrome d ubiquinol oxidase subunit I
VTHRAELSSFAALLGNSTVLVAFPHTLAGCFLTAGALVTGVAVWHLIRRPDAGSAAFRSAAKAGAVTVLVAAVALGISGDVDGKIMTSQQPMKMAAAEALYHTSKPGSFSLFTIGTLNGSREVYSIRVPGLLSFLASGSFNGKVDGIDNLQALYSQIYGPGSYTPIIPVTYWSFRLMIGVGLLAALIALIVLWAMRRGRQPRSRWLLWSVLALPLLPLIANSFGWIFTEMGRQPWIVFGQMKTAAGVSSGSAGTVLASLIVLTLLYGGLAVIEAGLLIKYARAGVQDEPQPPAGGSEEEKPLAFAC